MTNLKKWDFIIAGNEIVLCHAACRCDYLVICHLPALKDNIIDGYFPES